MHPRYAVKCSEGVTYYLTYSEAHFFAQIEVKSNPVQPVSIIRCGRTPSDDKIIESYDGSFWFKEQYS
jgi:hypothetical protein